MVPGVKLLEHVLREAMLACFQYPLAGQDRSDEHPIFADLLSITVFLPRQDRCSVYTVAREI